MSLEGIQGKSMMLRSKRAIRTLWMKKRWRGLFLVVVFLFVLRLLLPFFVKTYINYQLSHLEGYYGQVGDVDINLYRGAYELERLWIVKVGADAPVKFIDVPKIDISVFWSQLFKGVIVAEIEMSSPEINLVDDKNSKDKQFGEDVRWLKLVDSFSPIKIDKFAVKDGKISLRKFDANPPVDLTLTHVYGDIHNLTNSEKFSGSRVASGFVRGNVAKGTLEASLTLDPFSKKHDFDLDAKLIKVALPELNSATKEYGKFDFVQGTLSVYTEAAVENGQLRGYVKPLIWNANILSWRQDVKKDKDHLFKLFWEAIVGATGEILENQKKDQFATRIPLSGSLEDPDADLLSTVVGVLKNAFVRAFIPGLDKSVGQDGKDGRRDKKLTRR